MSVTSVTSVTNVTNVTNVMSVTGLAGKTHHGVHGAHGEVILHYQFSILHSFYHGVHGVHGVFTEWSFSIINFPFSIKFPIFALCKNYP